MDKFDHSILLKRILAGRAIPMPLKMSFGTYIYPPKYNRLGEKIAEELWGILSKEPEYIHIASDDFDDVRLVTIWTGIDKNAVEEHMPKYIFQSIILKNGEATRLSYLYPTESIAFKHHQKLAFMLDQKMALETMEN